MRIISNSFGQTALAEETGARIFELLGPSAALGAAKNHSIIRLELAPGACSPSTPHYHKQSEETYIILEGTADLLVGAERIALKTGDIAALSAYEQHQIIATGTKALVALAVMAPGFDPADVFEAGA